MKMKKSSLGLPMMTLAIMSAIVLFTGGFSYPVSVPAASAPAPSTSARQYASVTFRNVTGETIFFLYISERTNDRWGSDWLGSHVLENNDTYTTRLLTGEYDVRATDLYGEKAWSFWITVDAGGGTFRIEPSDRR
jgi:hypothetical protein